MIPYPETQQQGTITLENIFEELMYGLPMKGTFGVQISKEGRVWICINGISFLRFTPHPNGEIRSLGKGK